mgnify:FL=1
MFNWTKDEIQIVPITLMVIIFLSVIINFCLRNKSEKVKRIPLLIITIIILILEVIKQIYNLVIGYNLWKLPLHFCSIFLFVFSFASFGKGTLRKIGDVISLSGGFAVLVAFLISPRNIIGNACENVFANFDQFHTFTYHFLVFFYLFILIGSNLVQAKFSDIKYIITTVLGYAIIAIVAGYSLNVNFCSVLHNNYSFLEAIRLSCGPRIYLICLIIFGICALSLTYLPNIIITMLRKKKKN